MPTPLQISLNFILKIFISNKNALFHGFLIYISGPFLNVSDSCPYLVTTILTEWFSLKYEISHHWILLYCRLWRCYWWIIALFQGQCILPQLWDQGETKKAGNHIFQYLFFMPVHVKSYFSLDFIFNCNDPNTFTGGYWISILDDLTNSNLSLQSEADRTLIYITLYITECLKKLQKVKFHSYV